MRQLAKVLPALFGILLGWILVNPPAWLEPLGLLRFAVMGVLVLGLLVGFVALQLGRNLPEDVALVPRPGVEEHLEALTRGCEELGFVRAGPPVEVGVSPPAVLQALVHRQEPVYATVFRTGTLPAVTSMDFVSILHGDRGGLTTNADVRGATLPGEPGSLRQVFPGAGAAELFRRHCEALAWLRSRSLPPRPVSGERFAADFKMAMARQRRAFLAAPLRTALVAIWRSVSGRVPHRGALAQQAIAERQLRQLSLGR
ncbi:MAG: hypothetical protein MUF10_08380 [Thermoanaerobaculaceae bacterium]|jgi:hypothetical protein|nr:hypothetical protein [Thermoanaerobaculaceae bacterium]